MKRFKRMKEEIGNFIFGVILGNFIFGVMCGMILHWLFSDKT